MYGQRLKRNFFLRALVTAGAIAVCAIVGTGCSGKPDLSPEAKLRARLCKPVQSSKAFDETPYVGGQDQVLSFQAIRSSVNSACASCHQSPATTGGFSYVDSWQGGEVLVNGERVVLPGFFEAGERMRDSILNPDLSKRMPPAERRAKNPEIFLEIGSQLNQWITAGKPNGSFRLGSATAGRRGKERPVRPRATSELGDCVPTAEAIGTDAKKDREFAAMKSLPKFLSSTDMTTLDPLELARTGTIAYNVEYPLWADNADKGRWIHVPMKLINGVPQRQAIRYDAATKQFVIPDNTRFYKTFYRAVTKKDKHIRMRRMETRIIVARTPWEDSLFGTYQWDETEQVATLVETPYRDGTPWKDLLTDVIVDDASGKVRPYAIPGKQRCIDCHMGSPSRNFVLGFQPLQINRRALGAAGRIDPPSADDLNQVERFLSYGLISGISSKAELATLETSGTSAPQNEYELRANGYMVGNCYHCHNPNGLAFTKENGIRLALGPGEIFQFNTQQKSVQIPTRRLVHQNGELDSSHVWRKISDSSAQLGMFSQMPMHTPGAPDCRVMRVIGKWIRSFESPAAAELWEPACKSENPFFWIDMDFTWVKSDRYTPRRNDWKDPTEGMPQKYRDLELSAELKEAIQKQYAVGYWLTKPVCTFKPKDLPPEDRRPWMMKGRVPKRPFGEIYYATPGAYFFRNTCMKCHGPRADGDSSLARGILTWSGGSVRVANLSEGMFGKKNENLRTFDLDGRNLAGQYLIWMAMEGTRVRFPPEIAAFMGKHGGQMLNGIREKCLSQISSDKPSSPQFMDHEVFNKVCFMENLEPEHPDLEFDEETNEPLHPEAVEKWLDRAAWNAGWSIFDFLRSIADKGWPLNQDECELRPAEQ